MKTLQEEQSNQYFITNLKFNKIGKSRFSLMNLTMQRDRAKNVKMISSRSNTVKFYSSSRVEENLNSQFKDLFYPNFQCNLNSISQVKNMKTTNVSLVQVKIKNRFRDYLQFKTKGSC